MKTEINLKFYKKKKKRGDREVKECSHRYEQAVENIKYLCQHPLYKNT